MKRIGILIVVALSVTPCGWGKERMTPETFAYKQVGDLTIHLDVYRRGPESPQPVIVWIHGGALMVGDRGGIRTDQLELYLNAGYVVVSIDYRLAPETKLPDIVADVRDALGWVRQKGPAEIGIDPKRIAVIGHSAGGYLTLMSGSLLDPPPKALVSFYGYGDIIGDWYAKPDPHYLQQEKVPEAAALASVGEVEISGATQSQDRFKFYLWCRQNGLWPEMVGGVSPTMDPDFFKPFCPARNVGLHFPPTLLIHGDQDTDVPVQLSLQMEDSLQKLGIPVETIILPGAGHGFDGKGLEKSAEVKKVFDQVLRFLAEHL